MNGRSSTRHGTLRRRVAMASAVIMMGTLLQGVTRPAAAVDDGSGRPGLPVSEKPVPGSTLRALPPTRQARTPLPAPDIAWPKAATSVVNLPEPTAARGSASAVRAKGLPLELDTRLPAGQKPATGPIEAQVLSRGRAERAGVDGLLFTLRPTTGGADGRVRARLDYSAFADVYGGGYSSRLTLVELPGCALTTPARAACRTATPVPSANDTEKRTLTTTSVPLKYGARTVLAAVAGTAGGNGDYRATSLSASATWGAGLNTGDFTWSYPMAVPEVPGGLTPSVGLSYASGGVDGRTGNSNNQSSWAGDGFSLWPGFIERRYKSCADDGVENAQGHKPGDLCWGYDNAVLTFNGKGGELVLSDKGKDTWKLREDDGTTIKRIKDTGRGNGDKDGEYWLLTTPDGSKYYFGYHRLPGWADGKETTDSTWTVPVYGDDTGDECKGSSFADSWCQQAWRWNLDYAVDPHGNAMAYYYTKEANHYGRNLEAKDATPYVRGGTVDRIEYGLKSSSLYSSEALARVEFTNAERCLPTAGVDCSNIDAQQQYWYDTPWDLHCAASATCDKGRLSPAFFTRKRLTQVTTKVLNGTAYDAVDSWKLTHDWGMADTDYQLLLNGIQHTGHTASPAITQLKTSLSYLQLANRLDRTGDGRAPFIKSRLSSVTDENGGKIDVNYSGAACAWDALPTAETNTTRCFPQMTGGTSTENPTAEWFNKYVVTSVTQSDTTGGGAPDQVTQYDYKGDAAWHFDDDDGLTKEKHKTWSQWRGYGQVRVQTGGNGGVSAMRTQEDTFYLRGMHGDRKNKTTEDTKTVTVALDTGEGDPLTDHEAWDGFVYKTVAYDKPGGKVLSKTVNRPWRHETAQRVRSWGTVTTNFTGTGHTKSFTSLDEGAGAKWRTTSSATTFDTVAGRATEVDDHGDNSTATDNKCTLTTYAGTASDPILTLPSRVRTISKPCGEAVTPDDVIADIRSAYDGKEYGATPTRGTLTGTAVLREHEGGTAVYTESGSTYDAYGRQLTTTDLTADLKAPATGAAIRNPRKDGLTTTTEYTPATGFATTTKTTTPPAKAGDATTAQTTTTTMAPARGLPLTQADTNGKVTAFAYDALGRSTKVWLADRVTGQTPTYQFTYLPAAKGQPTAVGTKTIGNNDTQRTSYTLYDGFLRQRQTQAPGPDGGRLLTDTFYDERGLVTKEFSAYYATGAPQTGLFKPEDALGVETQTRHTYDGLNRPTEIRRTAGNGDGGAVLHTTKTYYGGDRVTVLPPEGGTATTTLIDARGNNTELRQHHQRALDSTYDTTHYGYSPRGELTKVTDPEGNDWHYGYDLLGRQTSLKDPDKGTTANTYNDRGQIVLTESHGTRTKLAFVYDGLGRKTALHKDSATGPLRAEWKYDTVSRAKGHLAETIRHENGAAYSSKIVAYDRLYRPTSTSITIPAFERELQGTYVSTAAYKLSGLPQTVGFPAAGALPATNMTFAHDNDTLRTTAIDGTQGLKASISYSLTGKPLQQELSNGPGKKTWVTNGYEWGTQRLSTTRVDRQDVPGVDQSNTYRYDEMGNIRSLSDVSRSGTDTQCFTHDFARRITDAWTQATTGCAASPSDSVIGGPAPYWHAYTYDKAGSRKTETLHDTTGDPSKKITRSYAYPGKGNPRPHSLTSVTATGPGGVSSSYDYDGAGNTTNRTVGTTAQTLEWDPEGHLARVTEPVKDAAAKVTEYLYDAEGNRLIGRTPTETTLYLGATQVTLAKGSTTPTATRYLDLTGGHQAVQENDGSVSFTLADHHGTAQLTTNAATQQLSQRRSLPFGGVRGTPPANWPGTKGFVGGTDDTKSTGLTHLGAREYDPSIGRFISVDPLLESDKPQTLNGYTYAAQNPLAFTDPTGLGIACGKGHEIPCPKNDPNGDGVTHPGTSRSNLVQRPHRPPPPPCGVFCGYGHRDAPGNGDPAGPALLTGSRTAPVYHLRAKQSPVSGFVKGVVNFLKPDRSNFEDCGTKGDVMACVEAAGDIPLPATKLIKIGTKVADAARGFLKAKKKCECFPAGTGVLMADGTTKAIEKVKAGDKVRATDPETGESGARTVTDLIRTDEDKHFNRLSIATDDGVKHLTATHEHPFWSPSAKTWLGAGDVKPGMSLLTDDGDTVIVTKNHPFSQQARTYNLTVDDLHTYYVLAGATPILVHNCNRASLDFTDAERQKVYDANEAKNGGILKCDYCGRDVVRRPSIRGVPGRPDDAQIDHIVPRASGGHGGSHNGAVACRRCNRDKSTKPLEDWDDELRDFLGP
ncbi:polymorphic toxin-type HINT domain-containing protein [Streptomyces jumonjinensis]|uniref:polymorphic toxin-type HINT domain-containing protein n=1 Tax=Streptomyces jumonjinensis TaxID=1945 RepID=UPI0037A826F9